jgi:hypothetical protein
VNYDDITVTMRQIVNALQLEADETESAVLHSVITGGMGPDAAKRTNEYRQRLAQLKYHANITLLHAVTMSDLVKENRK